MNLAVRFTQVAVGSDTATDVDEAVTLARRFCSDEAGALVNGVLGSLLKAVGGSAEEQDD